jgi:hypothetical protein
VDRSHRTTDDIAPAVPFRGPRGGIRPAALAGPEARPLRRCRGREETNSVRPRLHRWATCPAVDPRGRDARKEPTVEAHVPRHERSIAQLGVMTDPGAGTRTARRRRWARPDDGRD